MKRTILNSAVVALFLFTMSSCYTLTYTVGTGPKTGIEVKEKNHFVVAGLAAIKTSNPTQMAGGASDYQVTITHTFIDGLINVLTGGLYTPTTTIVKK